jgi:hypothetical protein
MDYLSIQKSWHAILVAMVVAQFNRPNPRRRGGGFEIALQIGELFDLGGEGKHLLGSQSSKMSFFHQIRPRLANERAILLADPGRYWHSDQ